jgi:predicted O-methyltransferase YrrM
MTLQGVLRRLPRWGRAKRAYPTSAWVTEPNHVTVDFVRQSAVRHVAEVGAYLGQTSEPLAEILNSRNGILSVFDFDHRVTAITERLRTKGLTNVVGYGNTAKLLDSYNWSVLPCFTNGTRFDYVFLDGAHTWPVDALAFLLFDRLLQPGGFMDFDDYHWTLAHSPTMAPHVFPETRANFTPEQIALPHVQLIVDTLVRPDPRYVEVVKNKIFQKIHG